MVKKTIRRGTCIVLVILMLSSALWYTNEVLRTNGQTVSQRCRACMRKRTILWTSCF